MSNSKDFNERMKKMKSSIEDNKNILEEEFPDDVLLSGNPDLIKNPKSKNREKDSCQKNKK
jgi:hypothetical protein